MRCNNFTVKKLIKLKKNGVMSFPALPFGFTLLLHNNWQGLLHLFVCLLDFDWTLIQRQTTQSTLMVFTLSLANAIFVTLSNVIWIKEILYSKVLEIIY